jgi:hypothetical protein
MHRSVNQANTYQCCPRKYRYRYLDQLPSKPSEFLAIGSAFDDAMTHIIKHFDGPTDQLLEDAIALMKSNAQKLFIQYELDAQTVRESMNTINHLARLIPSYWKKYLVLEGLEPVSTQVEINYQLDGLEAPVLGYIDMIARSKDTGDLVIVDFKTTGSREPSLDYKRQVWLYSKAIQQQQGLTYLPEAQLHMFTKATPTLAKKKREQLGLEELLVHEYPAELIDELYDEKTIQSKIGIHSVAYDEQEWQSFSELFFDLEFSLRFGHWPKNRTHYLCNARFCPYWVPCHSSEESLCSLQNKQQTVPNSAVADRPSPILDEDDAVPFSVDVNPHNYQQPVENLEDFLGTTRNYS